VIRPEQLPICRFGDIEVDESRMELRRGGSAIELEPKALRVLFCLIHNRDKVVTKGELIRQVWAGSAVTDNALTRAVAQLRKALNDDARQPRYIETVPTVGYRFLPSVKDSSEKPAAASRSRRWLWLWPAATAVGVVIFALAGRESTTRDDFMSLRPIQLTMEAGLTNSPAFSPDGGMVAYSSDSHGEGGRDLFVRYIAGADPSASHSTEPAIRCRISLPTGAGSYFAPNATAAVFMRFRRVAVKPGRLHREGWIHNFRRMARRSHTGRALRG
jgi:DNA-binding winged helix-turn-helix (wHTH) protein